MGYTLKFSDPANTGNIVVPDMPPGVNTVDTSLALIGPGYPNYAERIAENFLHLLENFASSLPPENPIEGQLWYDTSDPNNKVLRIMDGTADSTRWPVANGIYQQGSDPRNYSSAALKVGDIWVDTEHNQLKIYNSLGWTTVGPAAGTGGNKTGSESYTFDDAYDNLATHNVILNWANGYVVSVISSDNEFTPRTYPTGMEGFVKIKPGITLRDKDLSQVNKTYNLNGTATKAQYLEIGNEAVIASSFLRKDGNIPQIVTNKTVFQVPESSNVSAENSGISVRVGSSGQLFQFTKYSNDGLIVNYTPGGSTVFRNRSLGDSAIGPTYVSMSVSKSFVGINTSTASVSPAPNLEVNGSAKINSTLTVKKVYIDQSISINGAASVGSNLLVSGVTTSSGLLTLGTTSGSGAIIKPKKADSYDIGTTTEYFRHLYVSSIASPTTGTIVYGTLKGAATRLESATEFRLTGQVTAAPFLFTGAGTTSTFNAVLTRDAIEAQPRAISSPPTHTLLVLNTATNTSSLEKVSKREFLKDAAPVGSITLYAGLIVPDGWLRCNGNSYNGAPGQPYAELFATIGTKFGGTGTNFLVPNITSVPIANTFYIIRT